MDMTMLICLVLAEQIFYAHMKFKISIWYKALNKQNMHFSIWKPIRYFTNTIPIRHCVGHPVHCTIWVVKTWYTGSQSTDGGKDQEDYNDDNNNKKRVGLLKRKKGSRNSVGRRKGHGWEKIPSKWEEMVEAFPVSTISLNPHLKISHQTCSHRHQYIPDLWLLPSDFTRQPPLMWRAVSFQTQDVDHWSLCLFYRDNI